MAKKPSRVKVSRKKIILLTSIIFAVGIFMLFFNILLTSPNKGQIIASGEKDSVIEEPQQQSEDVIPPVTIPVPDDEPKLPEQVIVPPPEKPPVEQPDVKQPDVTQPPKEEITVPVKTKSGKLVFVFDDGGNNVNQVIPFTKLPFPITVAVLPGLPGTAETARLVRESGKELFLHQPMQAMDLSINPGPGAVLPDMTTGEAAQIVRQNIAQLAPVSGMNNHEGSLITSDRQLMGAVLDVCIDNDILFLDSRTTSATVVSSVALERGIDIQQRDIFLDNTQDEDDIRAMIQKGLDIADEKGFAIMIGHVWTPSLPGILSEMYPTLTAQGYTFTTPSALY